MSHWTIVAISISFIAVAPIHEAAARAGGAGGGFGAPFVGVLSHNGVWSAVIFGILALIVAYFYLMSRHWRRKAAENKDLLSKLGTSDPIWEPQTIAPRVKETFFRIQNAWAERDIDAARDYVTDNFLTTLKSRIDQMISAGEVNILTDIHFDGFDVVRVQDFNRNEDDNLWVFINASMIDYVIDEKTKKVRRGSTGPKQYFSELWKFTRQNDQWILDEIDSKARPTNIPDFQSFREAPSNEIEESHSSN